MLGTQTENTSWLSKSNNRYAAGVVSFVIVCSLMALSLDSRFLYLLVYAWFGVIYGVLLQYGRFCMASAVRDLFAVKVPRMAVGMMIAVALYSVVATVVTLAGFSTFHPNALGWHIMIGGAIFGFGIVFTGGCASGSLYKAGEGNMSSMLVILAISFSQAIVVSASGWWDNMVPQSWVSSAVAKDMPSELSVTQGWFDIFTAGYVWDLKGTTMAELLGMGGTASGAIFANAFLTAILPVTVILVLLYKFYFRKGYVRRTGKTAMSMKDELAGLWAMCTSSKNTALAGIGLGIFAGLHMYVTGALRDHYDILNFGDLLAAMGYQSGLSIQDTVFDPGYWYITTQEAQWGGWVLHQLGVENMGNIYFGLENGLPNPLLNAPGFMSIGIILGASVMALTRGEFKWKKPSIESAIFAVVGGTLMGIGARIGMGCNIGAFFATVTNGDPSGWIYLLGMVIGSYVGVKVFAWWMDWSVARNQSECAL
ncbi:MAG: YeeE/YedE family protein [Gammaproteobacteria bacterium]|nr:YeeE/YedE family protein [Gammaproteobacteria bacterium]MBU1968601.1 YeeE/YedE family protein [Gammaproteobacteria bacterium]